MMICKNASKYGRQHGGIKCVKRRKREIKDLNCDPRKNRRDIRRDVQPFQTDNQDHVL